MHTLEATDTRASARSPVVLHRHAHVSPPASRGRDPAIDTLRGLAAVLVVVFHSVAATGLTANETAYGHLIQLFQPIRVPLLAAIAGYVYALRPLEPQRAGGMLRKKARRLLVPWLSVTLLSFALKSVTTGSAERASWHELWRELVYPSGHLWFLLAILWNFVAVSALEVRCVLRGFGAWCVALGAAWLGATFLLGLTDLFCLSGALMIFPYFLFGLGIKRFSPSLLSTPAASLYWGASVSALAGLYLRQTGVLSAAASVSNLHVLVMATALAGALFHLRPRNRAFARLGRDSFAIYLFHLMAISLAIRVLKAAGSTNAHVAVATETALGVSLPLLAARVLDGLPLLRVVFLGESKGGE